MRPLIRHLIRRLPAAATAAAILVLLVPAAVRAEPAMWVVRDSDTTIYLFGTVHILKPGLAWETPRLAQAFGSCSRLTLEIADVDDPTAVQPAIQQYGFDRTHPLSAKLKPKERTKLVAAAAALKIDAGSLDAMRPWLAGVALSMAPVTRAGYDAQSGVELTLKSQADARHEPVDGMETDEQQIRALATLPEADQMVFLRESLDDFAKEPKDLERLAKAWLDGRVATIDREVNQDMRKQSPRLYQSLLADRNTAFAARIKAMLDQPGTRCVAIGAGHLAGADSVQSRLKALGVTVERY
jgi:hypothetical protein